MQETKAITQKKVRATDGLELSYRVFGDGPAVMLLHGFAQWSEMWIANGVAQSLSERFTVILPDRRGHGFSDRANRPNKFGMRMVEDVFRILEAETINTVHLVGFSQGSEVAWRAALEQPDRITSVFLISSGWPGPELDVALQGYSDILSWLPRAIEDGEDWLTPNPDLETFQAIVASMPDVIEVSERSITKLRVPVFGLIGAEDPERPTIEKLAGLLPDYSSKTLPGTDHPGSSAHPALPRLIGEFLAGVEARTTIASQRN